MKHQKLKIGFLNPGSLGNRHNEFLVAMDRHNVDLMVINETWLRQGEEGRAPRVPGYRLCHVPRPSEIRLRGGGVGFYLRRGLCTNTLKHPITPSVEQMWLSVNVRGKHIVIGTAYRPPWQSVGIFLDALTESISSLPFCDILILMGDFNINFINSSNTQFKMLEEFLSVHKLQQCINEPTHFTNNCETLLDLVCTNVEIDRVFVDFIPDLSNHSFISFEIKIIKEKIPPRKLFYRPIKNIEPELIKQTLLEIDWNYFNQGNDLNSLVDDFNCNLLWIFDLLTPVKVFFIKEHQYPWITYNIKLMMRRRDEAHKRARITKLTNHINYYKELKQIVTCAIVRERSAYFGTYIISNIKYPRTLWKHLKQHISMKTNNEIPLPLHLRDPDKLNNHFLKVPGRDYVPASVLSWYDSERFCTSTFNLQPVEDSKILKILTSLQSNAIGIDNISLDMLISSLPICLDILAKIINTSIITGKFPSQWKTAIVKAIPKKDIVTDFSDLRPISILPCISKILERIVCDQVTAYIESNNILPMTQSGFRKKHSTTTALTDVVDDILDAQDKGEGTLLVLLDYSRAFDTINRNLFLSKLRYYGFSDLALSWFRSYLSDRYQLVDIRNEDGTSTRSEPSPVYRGTPQGSILSPIIFALYSADLIKHIKHCKYHIYADDIQIYISFKPCETRTAINKLNEDLARIAGWSEENSLVLNPDKTSYLILGTKNQISRISETQPHIHIQNVSIKRVTDARNLGVIMDESLRFEKHVIKSVSNCFYRLKVLYKIRNDIPTKLRVNLCESLVLSKLNYADTVIGPRLLARSKNLIQRVQNACARYCFDIPPREHVTPYLNNAKILKMEHRRHLHLATLLFGIVYYKTPCYLYNKLKWASQTQTAYSTRASGYMLLVQPHRTAAFRGSFRYAATKCWNNLPPPVRTLKSIKNFKVKFKLHLLDLQSNIT